MTGGSFSLTEKLAVAGAFLALVALAVGTEDDPGLVITSREAVKELRAAAPAPLPMTSGATLPPQAEPEPEELALPEAEMLVESLPPLQPEASGDDFDAQFSPELGRVPQDFSQNPPTS